MIMKTMMLWEEAVLQNIAGNLLEFCCTGKKSYCLKLGEFQNCVHCTEFKKKINVRGNTCLYVYYKSEMNVVLSSVASRNCPLYLFKTEVHN